MSADPWQEFAAAILAIEYPNRSMLRAASRNDIFLAGYWTGRATGRRDGAREQSDQTLIAANERESGIRFCPDALRRTHA